MSQDVFISFHPSDHEKAIIIHDAITFEGFSCWINSNQIEIGNGEVPIDGPKLKESKALVFLLSSRSNVSRFLNYNVRYAYENNIPIIPLLIENIEPNKFLQFYLKNVDVLKMHNFESKEEIDTLLLRLKKIIRLKPPKINVFIKNTDALTCPGDVLICKYAKDSCGFEQGVIEKLKIRGATMDKVLTSTSKFLFKGTNNLIKTKYILFIAVKPLKFFDNKEIREFAERALAILSKSNPDTKDIVITLPSVELRTRETLKAEISGFIDALEKNLFPIQLEKITFVEKNEGRYGRIKSFLDELLPNGYISIGTGHRDNILDKKPPNVFISSKSEDFSSANLIYNFLRRRGYDVFFSHESIPDSGNADYRKEIDKALAVTQHMIVVTSSKENVEAPWVEAEWGLFINEKRSGRKTGNLLTILIGDISIEDLPPSLRYYQVLPFDTNNFKEILRYLN